MKKSFFYIITFFFLISSIYGIDELVGRLSQEDILENLPNWQGEVASYFPKPEIIEHPKKTVEEDLADIIESEKN